MGASTDMKLEGSKYDNDKGVKEGSKADMARDKKERASMKSGVSSSAKFGNTWSAPITPQKPVGKTHG